MAEIDLLFSHLPPVTRFYFFLSTALMLMCTVDLVSPFSLYMNYHLVLKHFQLWRIFTCFLYFGTFSLHFFWNVYVLIFYCSTLEEHERSATFLWMVFTTGTLLLVFSYMLGLTSYFYSGSMINVMTYIWGRRNPNTRLSVFFISISGPYLAYTLAFMSVLVGWNMADHFVGILVGHIYFFFEDIYPLLPTSKGVRIFATPKFLLRLFKEHGD